MMGSRPDSKGLKVVSLNINGIRSGARKGFFEWMQREDPDVLCLQETKAQVWQLEDEIFHPLGFHNYFVDAEKKGYSGVAIYSKQEPREVRSGLDWPEADCEGRYLELDYGDYVIASLYLPSGTSSDERQDFKYTFLDFYEKRLREQKQSGREYILCGDWNIAHKKIDIKNWRSNQNNSGFLPKERAWMDKLFDDLGFVDAFRVLNQEADQYTWWSHRGQAWANNVGWRIDYQVITPGLKDKVKQVAIYREEKFSDHAPLIIEYDL